MTLLFGAIGTAVLFSGELYDHQAALLRTLPRAMRFSHTDTDMYWFVMLTYLRHLNDFLCEEAVLTSYDEEREKFVYYLRKDGKVEEHLTIPARTYDETTATEEGPTTTVVTPEGMQAADELIYTHSTATNLYYDIEAENISYFAARGEFKISDGNGYLYDTAGGIAWANGALYVISADRDADPIPGTDYCGYPYAENESLREYLRDNRSFVPSDALAADAVIVLLPNARIVDRGGLLSSVLTQTYMVGAVCWGIAALILLIFALFIGVAIDHRSREAADAVIGRGIGRIWIEIRLCVLAVVLCFYIAFFCDVDEAVGGLLIFSSAWFWFYLIGTDLRENGLRTFTCNIVSSMIALIRRRTARLPLHKEMARRFLYYAIPAAFCALAALLFFSAASMTYGLMLLIYLLLVAYAAISACIFIFLYFRSRNTDYADIAAIAERICAIRDGHPNAPLSLPEHHRFSPYAEALEGIYSGIETAVAERTRSERTKIEMVTNISHDLKTPLTSIVGYADLLAGVDGLPPEAADYVAVITKKSERLNALIKDLFDLSKATTNDLPLRPEPIDLVRLLNQLLAEQADTISAAPVTVAVNLPPHECLTVNDGTKLYRIFANLLENALRYSLEGSRIFLTLSAVNTENTPAWRITVKNISREFIDFTEEEILSRFVRGDKNRTSEGSGLGLPIAKSFTELCGGSFSLTLDGDIFCVTVDFPQNAAQCETE